MTDPTPEARPSRPRARRRLGRTTAAFGLMAGVWLTGCAVVSTNGPPVADVEAGAPMSIDGTYVLTANRARYRVERGRVYTLDRSVIGPAVTEPGRVVTRDLQQIGPRSYVGYDVAAKAPWYADVRGDGRLSIRIATMVAQFYELEPVELDDPEWAVAQRRARTLIARNGEAAAPMAPPAALVVEGGGWAPGADRSAFGRYHALVVGNDEYTGFARLGTAVHDARSVAALLEERYAMEVTLLTDATRAEILSALDDLRRSLTPTDNLLIYYAGHGWLDEDGDEGYWLPVDATRGSTVNWISNSSVTTYLKAIQARHVLVVADSCFAGTLTRGIQVEATAPDHLTRMAARRARVVLTSGGMEPVADSGGGEHSAFAAAFIARLRENRAVLDTATLFAQIRRPIMLAADQAPQLADIRKAGHEGGDFLFVPVR